MIVLAFSLLALPVSAQGASLTFKTTGKQIDRIQLPATSLTSRPSGAGVSAVESDTICTDGKVLRRHRRQNSSRIFNAIAEDQT